MIKGTTTLIQLPLYSLNIQPSARWFINTLSSTAPILVMMMPNSYNIAMAILITCWAASSTLWVCQNGIGAWWLGTKHQPAIDHNGTPHSKADSQDKQDGNGTVSSHDD